MDIPKFCSKVLNTQKNDDELQGKVVTCLRKRFIDKVCVDRQCYCTSMSISPLYQSLRGYTCHVNLHVLSSMLDECLHVNKKMLCEYILFWHLRYYTNKAFNKVNTIQLLTGFEDNSSFVWPSNESVLRSNKTVVVLEPSQ